MVIRRVTLISTRREWLQRMGLLGGGALLSGAFTTIACGRTATPDPEAEAIEAPPADTASALDASRAQMAAAPIEMMELGAGMMLLSGPGGNVVVLDGADGKFVVDTFVQPAWTPLKAALDGIGPSPLTAVINTHWHFDHSDNNARFREAGARIVAHENTAARMSQSHQLLGMQVEPSPEEARPTETFPSSRTLEANGETIELAHIPPAHTDTDISVHYTKANVLHAGDTFFVGTYPFIDAGTGGNIGGMIGAAERLLKMADSTTRIVPGHGPLTDRAMLARYRDMLASSRDRVLKLKTAGRSLEEVQAERPTMEFDEVWGKGFLSPDDFVALVYGTL
jgi:glyoxylase-like metal-dependent hydrolase (beta-lactamase superfamily II)